ncbi:MAG: FKBP-type peptidyl-prolyl cis-trans isomerase [Candidatus Paceibacterota bacterium]
METKKIIIIVAIIAVIIIGIIICAGRQSKELPEPIAENSSHANIINPEDAQGNVSNSVNTNQTKMKIEILKQGAGAESKAGDSLTVNYTGTFENGTKFDSSLNPGREPFVFTVGAGQVIKGWDQGMVGMKVGEQRKLTIPPELGYGESGIPGAIPGNATLVFVVDLLKIN